MTNAIIDADAEQAERIEIRTPAPKQNYLCGMLEPGTYEGCPMTVGNCEEYHISDAMAKRFCSEGCSSVCGQQFRERFGKRVLKND